MQGGAETHPLRGSGLKSCRPTERIPRPQDDFNATVHHPNAGVSLNHSFVLLILVFRTAAYQIFVNDFLDDLVWTTPAQHSNGRVSPGR